MLSFNFSASQICSFRNERKLSGYTDNQIAMMMYNEKVKNMYKGKDFGKKIPRTKRTYWDDVEIKAGLITIDGKIAKGLWINDKSPKAIKVDGVDIMVRDKVNIIHPYVWNEVRKNEKPDQLIDKDNDYELTMYNNAGISCVALNGKIRTYPPAASVNNMSANSNLTTAKINSFIGFRIYRPKSLEGTGNAIVIFMLGKDKYEESTLDIIDDIKNQSFNMFYDRDAQQYVIEFGNIKRYSVKMREIFGRAFVSARYIDGVNVDVDRASEGNSYVSLATITNFENESLYKEF